MPRPGHTVVLSITVAACLALVTVLVIVGRNVEEDFVRLQGLWEVTFNGAEPTGDCQASYLFIENRLLVLADQVVVREYLVTLSATTDPKQIDAVPIRGDRVEVMRGIYLLGHDELVICGRHPLSQRPAGFDDPQSYVIHLKRVSTVPRPPQSELAGPEALPGTVP